MKNQVLKLAILSGIMFLTSCATQWHSKLDSPNVKIGSSASWGIDQNNNFRIYAIGGDNQTNSNNLVDGFDVFNNNWQSFSPMINDRTRHASVTFFIDKDNTAKISKKSASGIQDIKIYVFGGQSGNVSLNTCEVYDTRNDNWTPIASMSTARHGLAAATGNNGKIYVFGGENGSNFFDSVEEYDPVTNTWSTKSPMPDKRAWLGAATGSDGYIYLTGGNSMGPEEDNLWRYDPQSDTYSILPNMPSVSSRHDSAAGHGDKIFVLGNVSYAYDISDNSWSIIDEMPCEYRIDAAAESFNGIYLIGGYRRFNSPTNCNEVYSKGW